MSDAAHNFLELIEIIKRLRDPVKGCPWDLEQTHQSLKPYMVEEAYEAVEAMDGEPDKLREELGDVLLQVVLHSQIASEAKTFDIARVVAGLSKKLVERHPHVFGSASVKDSAGVVSQWEKIKKEKNSGGTLSGIPKSMPALLRALRLGEKSARVGFDWKTPQEVKQKVREELEEFLHEQEGSAEADEELGDLLFSLAQYIRKTGKDPELLLQRANEKFIARFERMEAGAGKPLKEFSMDELEELWQAVKEKV